MMEICSKLKTKESDFYHTNIFLILLVPLICFRAYTAVKINSVVLIWYAYHQKLNFQHVVNKLHKHIHRRVHSAKKKRKKHKHYSSTDSSSSQSDDRSSRTDSSSDSG